MTKRKLVLGSAGIAIPDAVTLDIDPGHRPDVVHDLNVMPWPFKDGEFQEIICHHVLEHLSDLGPVMNELHRLCALDGMINIEVPHHSSWCAHAPEHKMFFGAFAFDGYVTGGLIRWMTGKKFDLVRREITFHRSFRRVFLHKIFNRCPEAYERFWTYIFPAENLKIRLRPVKDGS